MYSLHLTCRPEDIDAISTDLWEAGTAGVQEISNNDESITLVAGFESNLAIAELRSKFSEYKPTWQQEADADWVKQTQLAWPGRIVGEQLFLAAPWCEDPTPFGRYRIIHNPGLACGTGEHPCTQLALTALERTQVSGLQVLDIGTGSGLLAIAALKLGAVFAAGADIDEAALTAAKENFHSNGFTPALIAGSSDCFEPNAADLIVANINATVLFSMADDLFRIVRPNGTLILTGFTCEEVTTVQQVFPIDSILEHDGWSCLISKAL